MVFRFIGLHERHQYVEAVAFGRVTLRAHQRLDLREGGSMVERILDRLDIYGRPLQIVCASIWSYCAWVPMNRV